MTTSFLFTSESVAAGHPDKMCDNISDAILDAFIRVDPGARVAVETFVKVSIKIINFERTTE